jgi:hypothetical protein
MDLREIYGWPLLSQAKFGRAIMPLFASLRARRVKASSIVYVGICIPAALRAEAAQLGLVHLQQSRSGALSNRGDESAQQRSRMT